MFVPDTITRTVVIPTSGGRADSTRSAEKTAVASTHVSSDKSKQTSYNDTSTYRIPRRDLQVSAVYDKENVDSTDTSMFLGADLLGNDSMYSTTISGKQHGEAGEPLQYNVGGDNVITALLIATILLTLLSLSRSRRLIVRQTKNFFRIQHGDTTVVPETGNEIAAQLFLALQTCLLLSVLAFLYITQFIAEVVLFDSPYTLLWILIACFVAYYVVKTILYTLVDCTFFDMRSNERWLSAYLYILAVQGLIMLPIVLLQVYFDLAIETVLIYTLSVAVLAKILSFYKCYTIFFKRSGGLLQLILYFCALEMTPVLLLWGIMVTTVDYFKINI